ncbi:MAG: DNA polymerase III subunit delta [Peptococcaceae bacterium]|nr:DNA polymerase III subunit delta [Peptococcaceae bacterium]
MRYFIDLVEDLKSGRFAPVYLFFGPEDYLRREAVKKIRDFLLAGEADDFNYTEVDGEEAPLENIVSLAAIAPFFSEKRLVVVKNAKFFTGKKGAANYRQQESASGEPEEETGSRETPLLKYLAHPTPSTCLVFDAGDQVDKRKKIFKETARVGKAIEFTPLKPEELSVWLEKQARLSGKTLAPGTAAQILARAGSNLQSLAVEIQKLITYAGDNKVITVSDVAAATPAHPEEDVFAVVDAIGERNPARAITGINRLVRQKQPPPVIMTMVARQIRLIMRAGEALRAGTNSAGLASRLGVHPYVAKKAAIQQKNFTRRRLISSLYRLHELDVAVKSGKQEFLPGMEMLIMDICRKN